MKHSLLLFASLAMLGCSASTKEVSSGFIMPSELSGCKVFELSNGSRTLYVVTCHESISTNWQTSHAAGKTVHYEDHSVTVRKDLK